MNCQKCGKDIPEDAGYCLGCGIFAPAVPFVPPPSQKPLVNGSTAPLPMPRPSSHHLTSDETKKVARIYRTRTEAAAQGGFGATFGMMLVLLMIFGGIFLEYHVDAFGTTSSFVEWTLPVLIALSLVGYPVGAGTYWLMHKKGWAMLVLLFFLWLGAVFAYVIIAVPPGNPTALAGNATSEIIGIEIVVSLFPLADAAKMHGQDRKWTRVEKLGKYDESDIVRMLNRAGDPMHDEMVVKTAEGGFKFWCPNDIYKQLAPRSKATLIGYYRELFEFKARGGSRGNAEALERKRALEAQVLSIYTYPEYRVRRKYKLRGKRYQSSQAGEGGSSPRGSPAELRGIVRE